MAAGNDAPRFTPSERATAGVLEARILVAITYPHGHPGVPGIPEGEGCPRCNAEKALTELVRRVIRHG